MSKDKAFYEMIKTQIRNTREMINANIGNNNTLSYFVNMTETLSNILQESNSELISRDKQILEQSKNNKIVNEYAERISILEDKIRELSMTPSEKDYETKEITIELFTDNNNYLLMELEKGVKEAIDYLNDAIYSSHSGCLVEGKNEGSHVELARNTLRNINLKG